MAITFLTIPVPDVCGKLSGRCQAPFPNLREGLGRAIRCISPPLAEGPGRPGAAIPNAGQQTHLQQNNIL